MAEQERVVIDRVRGSLSRPVDYVELEPGQPFNTWTPAQIRARHLVDVQVWHAGAVLTWAEALEAGLVGPGPVPIGRAEMTETRGGVRG